MDSAGRGSRLVRDLLDLPAVSTAAILDHPVFRLFIQQKWNKVYIVLKNVILENLEIKDTKPILYKRIPSSSRMIFVLKKQGQ